MSMIGKLEALGLDVELEAIINSFIATDGDEATAKELRSKIDETGLKSSKTMSTVGLLQRANRIKPGIYKELVALNKRLEGGEVEAPPQESKVEASTPSAKNQNSGGVIMSESVNETEVVTEGNVVPMVQEETDPKLKAALAKLEESHRKRALAVEMKYKERKKNQDERKAKRQGMNLETLQAIAAKKAEIAEIKGEYDELRVKMKTLREELRNLKPQRAPKKDKPAKDKKTA